VRLISWWLRMAFTRRDIGDHPFYEFLGFEDHLFNASSRWDIPWRERERRHRGLGKPVLARALSAILGWCDFKHLKFAAPARALLRSRLL
jgi:hypothetical protein